MQIRGFDIGTSISRMLLIRCHMNDSCSKWHRWESEAISSTGFVLGFPDVDSVYRVRSFWSRSLRSGTLRLRSFGSEAKFGHFGCGHYGPGHFGRGHFCLYFKH